MDKYTRLFKSHQFITCNFMFKKLKCMSCILIIKFTMEYVNVTGSNFEITFVLEKRLVKDDVLFTNHLAGK